MHALRRQILHNLEQEDGLLNELWKDWLALEPLKVHTLPPNEGWTLMQAASHLCQAETLAIQYIQKKSLADHLPAATLESHWRLFLLQIVLALPLKLKAPKVVSIPPHYETMDALIQDWKATRMALKTFFEQLDESKLNLTFFKHPVAGMLTPLQMVRFFQTHLHHHLTQFRRLENKLKTV